MTKKEFDAEVEYFKSLGITDEEIDGMLEFFGEIIEKPKNFRVINASRKIRKVRDA